MTKATALLTFLFCCFDLTAQEYYRWTDANGQLHISQSPPAKSVQYEVVTLQQLSKQQLHKPRVEQPYPAAHPSPRRDCPGFAAVLPARPAAANAPGRCAGRRRGGSVFAR